MGVPRAVSTHVTYRSYAKINLYLQVLERRDDGYHNIETVFQTIDLSDTLEFRLAPASVSIDCASAELDLGDGNLIRRAAALLQEQCGCDKGVEVRLDKQVPISAGLAGGSGNAAATLIALNELWSLGLPSTRLLELAFALGSDVPYCTVGGTVAATGRGEALKPLSALRETWFVLVHPRLQLDTGRVYNHPMLKRSDEERIDGMTASFGMALGELKKGGIADIVFNAMESAVFSEYPDLAVLKQRLLDAGCAAALMSGSGPTFFGLCKDRAHADSIAATFETETTSVVSTVPHGVQRVD